MGLMKVKLWHLVNHSQNENVHFLLARYLLEQSDKIGHLSINKVVNDTLVSKTSVLKFCSYFGYNSWKKFCYDLQEDLLVDQQQFTRLKMNSKLALIQEDLQEYHRQKRDFFEEVEKSITITKIKNVVTAISETKNIIIIGNAKELPLFYDLQDFLFHYHKNIVFPKFLNSEDYDKQMNNLEENTLLIICDGTNAYENFVERELYEPAYCYSDIVTKGYQKVFIGQKSDLEYDDIIYLELPFTFDQYFINQAIIDVCYQIITYYAYKY